MQYENGPSTKDLWEQHASWWQEQFTNGVDPEYEEQILPLFRMHLGDSKRVLEIGTGEGQVARYAMDDPNRFVVGCDPTKAQIVVAKQRGGGPEYVQCGAEFLSFAAESFDAVVACLVFEHIDDIETALHEVSRVLRPGGKFLFFLNHPLLQTPGSGWIDDQILDPPEQYWRIGEYLREQSTVEQVERGVFIRFVHRPLHRYINTMAQNNLYIQEMVEPSPPQGFLDRAQEYVLASSVPRLLLLVAQKPI